MAAVSQGKKVLVGVNETAMVADHDFSKISIIPDAVLIQDVPEPYNCEHQISLNDMDNESENEDAVITVNPAKKLNFFITNFYSIVKLCPPQPPRQFHPHPLGVRRI